MWPSLNRLLCPQYQAERRQREAAEAEAAKERRQREAAEAEAAKEHDDAYTDRSPLQQLLTGLRAVASRPGELVAGVTLLGFLLYGVSWYAYERFYSSFELAPEEVGLTYGTILVRTAVSIGIIGLYGVAYTTLGLAALTVGSLRHYFRIEDTLLLLSVQLLSITVLMGYAAYLTLLYENIQDASNMTRGIYGVVILMGCFLIFLPWTVVNFVRTYSVRFVWLRSFHPFGLIVLGALIVATALYFSTTLADRLADRVKGDQGLTTSPWLPYMPLDIQAAPVGVEWLQGAVPTGLPNNPSFYYFGQAGELTILYESTTKKTFRVPTQSLVMHQR
jgi:hypothetical protein